MKRWKRIRTRQVLVEADMNDEQRERNHTMVGLQNGNPNVIDNVLGREEFRYWNHLNDRGEHRRLHDALIRAVNEMYRREHDNND